MLYLFHEDETRNTEQLILFFKYRVTLPLSG